MNSTLERVLARFNLNPKGDYRNSVSPLHLLNFSRNELAGLFGELGFKHGVEVGTETGQYARALVKFNPGLKLHCVDSWRAYLGYRDHVNQAKLEGFYETAKQRLAEYDVEFIREFSMDAVRRFEPESLDFAYLDSNHAFDWIMQDIIEWSKRVRPDGIVAGHDFNRHPGWGVIEAVKAYTAAHRIKPWFTLSGTAETPEGHSWFFVKS